MHKTIEEIRADFPFFKDTKLAYLDNSATSQRPTQVIEAVEQFYYHKNANPSAVFMTFPWKQRTPTRRQESGWRAL